MSILCSEVALWQLDWDVPHLLIVEQVSDVSPEETVGPVVRLLGLKSLTQRFWSVVSSLLLFSAVWGSKLNRLDVQLETGHSPLQNCWRTSLTSVDSVSVQDCSSHPGCQTLGWVERGHSRDRNKVGWRRAAQAASLLCHAAWRWLPTRDFSTQRMLLPVNLRLVVSAQLRGPCAVGKFMVSQTTWSRPRSQVTLCELLEDTRYNVLVYSLVGKLWVNEPSPPICCDRGMHKQLLTGALLSPGNLLCL